jgi:hypothetical protein
MGHSFIMGAKIDFNQLAYEDLVHLGNLAAEAMALSHQYDRARAPDFCELIVACNLEMLSRRRQAKRRCGTAPAVRASPMSGH